MTLTRRQALIGAAATVAAGVLPASKLVETSTSREVIEMTIDGCQHTLSVPWMGDGAPDVIRVGDMFPTKMRDRETGRQVCLLAIRTPEIA
jgi:hypothetical protein